MEPKLFAFLKKCNENLHKIAKEAKEDVEKGFLWEEIHKYDRLHPRCISSTRSCFFSSVFRNITRTTFKLAVSLSKTILTALSKENVDTEAQLFSQFNRRMGEKFGFGTQYHSYSQRVMKLPPERKKARTEIAEERKLQKNAILLEVEDTRIYKAIETGYLSLRLEDQLIAAALASGARLIELIYVSTYKIIDEHTIEVDRTAKSKVVKKILKPIISLNTTDFCKLLDRIRCGFRAAYTIPEGDLNLEQKQALTQNIDHSLNERVREIFSYNVHFHDLRAIYGTLSFQLFSRDGSLNMWLRRVLGHSEKNLTASLSYSTIKIKRSERFQMLDMKDTINILAAKVDSLLSKQAVQPANHISLLSKEGKEVFIQRQLKKRDGKQQERLAQHAKELTEKSVNVNWENLLKLGYGTKTVQAFLNKKEGV